MRNQSSAWASNISIFETGHRYLACINEYIFPVDEYACIINRLLSIRGRCYALVVYFLIAFFLDLLASTKDNVISDVRSGFNFRYNEASGGVNFTK